MTIEIDLKGQVAVVTGASRGIGAAIAGRLAAAGANVALVARNAEALGAVASELQEQHGVDILAVPTDLTQPDQVDAMAQAVLEHFGQVDILVNNAGITRDGLLLRMSLEQWQSVIDADLTSVYACTRAFLRSMIKRRCGAVVNVSSVIGLRGNAGQSNYAAAKAGIIGFSKSIAAEVAQRGIRVNVVAPGFIQTDMTAELTEAQQEQILQQVPVRSMGTAEQVADAVAFLASPLASYITATLLRVDGGLAV